MGYFWALVVGAGIGYLNNPTAEGAIKGGLIGLGVATVAAIVLSVFIFKKG